jgi:hypothetical protein
MYVVKIIVIYHHIIFLYLMDLISNSLPLMQVHEEDIPRELVDADERDTR